MAHTRYEFVISGIGERDTGNDNDLTVAYLPLPKPPACSPLQLTPTVDHDPHATFPCASLCPKLTLHGVEPLSCADRLLYILGKELRLRYMRSPSAYATGRCGTIINPSHPAVSPGRTSTFQIASEV